MGKRFVSSTRTKDLKIDRSILPVAMLGNKKENKKRADIIASAFDWR